MLSVSQQFHARLVGYVLGTLVAIGMFFTVPLYHNYIVWQYTTLPGILFLVGCFVLGIVIGIYQATQLLQE